LGNFRVARYLAAEALQLKDSLNVSKRTDAVDMQEALEWLDRASATNLPLQTDP
jgi:hypothetical protein